ncbi:MAG: hypothetical protein ACPL07_00775 [Candidatus Bathyarchaeia archaeon]
MVDEKFLEKLKDYLNEKYKDKPGFKPFEIDMRPVTKKYKWEIFTYWGYGVGVHEFVDDEKIEVCSHAVHDWEEGVEIWLWDFAYYPALKKAKTEEEKEEILKNMRREKEEILKVLADRGRWRKYLGKQRYRGFILPLFWGEEVARRVRGKYGINVEFKMGPGYATYFSSIFNPKGMVEEQIFEEIVRRADVIHVAYLMCNGVPPYHKEEQKFYKGFEAKVKAKKE